DQPFLRQLRNNSAASQNYHVFSGGLLHLSHFRRQVALYKSSVVPRRMVKRSREHNLRHIVHPCGHNRHTLDRKGRRPEACHEVIGDPAEDQHASSTSVSCDKRVPLRVLMIRFAPAHIAVAIYKVTVQRHVIENDQFPHVYTPFNTTVSIPVDEWFTDS